MDARVSNLEQNEGNDNVTAELKLRVTTLEETSADHENRLTQSETTIEGIQVATWKKLF